MTNRVISYRNTDIDIDSGNIYTHQIYQNNQPVESIADYLDTKGDLLTFSTTVEKIARGTNGQILSVDDLETNGLKWIPNTSVPPVNITGETIEVERVGGGFNPAIVVSTTQPDDNLNYAVMQYKTGVLNDYFYTFAKSNFFYVGSTTVPECLRISHDTGDTLFSNDITCNTLNYTALNPPISPTISIPLILEDSDISSHQLELVNTSPTFSYNGIQFKTTSGPDFNIIKNNTTLKIGPDTYIEAITINDDGTVDFPYNIPSTPPVVLTTKGDLYTYDTSNVRLPVGTDDYILHSDSSTTTGLKWGRIDSISANMSANVPILALQNQNGIPANNFVNLEFHADDTSPDFNIVKHINEFGIYSDTQATPIIKMTNAGIISMPLLTTNFTGYYVCTTATADRTLSFSGSSLRYKTISETTLFDDTSRLYDLTPKEYYFNDDLTQRPNYSIIAEDCHTAFPELCIYKDIDGTPTPDSVDDQSLLCVCLTEIKNLKTQLTTAQQTIQTQNNTIGTLSSTLLNIMQRLDALENI